MYPFRRILYHQFCLAKVQFLFQKSIVVTSSTITSTVKATRFNSKRSAVPLAGVVYISHTINSIFKLNLYIDGTEYF